jgi:nucleoside-diphosphate-sugar epimerase
MEMTDSRAGRLLITGAAGLVGTALVQATSAKGFGLEQYDLRFSLEQDVLNRANLASAVAGCRGVVHLAAVSRVIWGEQDPVRCKQVNVDGLSNVLGACLAAPHRPWVLFASSREVYGSCSSLPANEDAPANPVNAYGHTKLIGENLVRDARRKGLQTATVRLSNVYGRADDHADRVVPAFIRAALDGRPLRVEGRNHTFDFTFVDDVARGLVAIARHLEAGALNLPDLHLVSGRGTTLGELADLVLTQTGSSSGFRDGAERDFDVAHFVGDPTRAEAVLGWRHETTLRQGLSRMIAEFRAKQQPAAAQGGQE